MLATDKYPSATIRIHPTLSSWQMTSVATLPCVWGWSRWQPTLDRLPKKVDPGSLIVLLVWRETTTHLIPGLSGVDHYRGHCIRISSQLNSFLNFPKIPKSEIVFTPERSKGFCCFVACTGSAHCSYMQRLPNKVFIMGAPICLLLLSRKDTRI